ncbi:MAG: ABC transporter ATP-binding protein [Pseudomonadota bacterium]
MEQLNPAAMDGAADALRLRSVSKSFGELAVLQSVDFDVRWGEVHALLGENGAGKSTLMNILAGIYSFDDGEIDVNGERMDIRSPAHAMRHGIGMVHQHFKLVSAFTARENLHLAASSLNMTHTAVDADIEKVLSQTGLGVPLDVAVGTLSVAERQRIEILKTLILGARILILDEPTAVLTDQEAGALLDLMRDLAGSGRAIVFITHKLREVMQVADRVSTLRQGQMVMAGHTVADVTPQDLSIAMIGVEQTAASARPAWTKTPAILEIDGLNVEVDGVLAVDAVCLTIHAGEIVGLAGVGGNGQRELAEAVLGTISAAGRIDFIGQSLGGVSVADRRALGMRYIPADRTMDALSSNTTVAENIAATQVRTGALGRRIISQRRIAEYARGLIERFGIAGVTAGGRGPIRLLSGGNAQKCVLARELDADAKLIIAHSPTRGLDVAACRYVHDTLIEATKRGVGILLISEDLEEILTLSDHIHVISRGALSTTPNAKPAREDIGTLMLGHA